MAEGWLAFAVSALVGVAGASRVDHERPLRFDCDPLRDWVLRLVCSNTHASIRMIAAALQGPRQHRNRNQLVWE